MKLPRNPLRRSWASSAQNAGESAICEITAKPSAEIVRVECAKCRRECDLSHARATLCGDRACRVREMQARVRLVRCPRSPLRRSWASSARNAGESAICPVRVECAKCRRECDLSCTRAKPLRISCVSSARNAGESAMCPVCAQPSAEILQPSSDRSLLRQTCCVAASAIFYFHSSSLFSVRCPGGVHAASQGMDTLRWMLRLSEGRAPRQKSCVFYYFPLPGGRPASYFLHFVDSEEIHHLPLPAAQMLTTMS